ncbi:YdeI family protein [Sungkyunkwania multivorans]|uniref:YdeI family protein n=1 Tax=Sungkyunkwania multivorans TaxID=1173618 RepID=A0ABW3CUE8_9FLAO
MDERPELYFQNDTEWYDWLLNNHDQYPQGVYLIFYKLEAGIPTMRWEEAVRTALCFGWIDSTVKNMGGPKRRQYFCPRNPKSPWSKVNKDHVKELKEKELIHQSGLDAIRRAKKDGSWSEMDDVENGIIPKDLQKAFDENLRAYENYQNFARGYRKSYLSWLHQAKREATRQNRIEEIIRLCEGNIKSKWL